MSEQSSWPGSRRGSRCPTSCSSTRRSWGRSRITSGSRSRSTRFWEAVLNAIPMDLKRAIGVGIGLFIAFIGLVNAGIVVHPEAGTIVALHPDLTTLKLLTFAIGFAVTAALVARRIRGALLFG